MFKFFVQLLFMLIISNLSNGRYIEESNDYHLSLPPQLPHTQGAMANSYYNYPYSVAARPYYYPHHHQVRDYRSI